MVVSSTVVTLPEFKEALGRYEDVLANYSKPPKEGQLSLEELDKFRYQTAPSSFSKSTGRVMELSDVKKLLEWKMRHGTFRPNLGKLVASNTDEKVAAATKDAFSHYTNNPDDIKGVLEKLATPLKGIGPATASLLLAVHDPAYIIYFSDELYRWLLFDGKKAAPKYTAQEFVSMYSKANEFMERLNCTPIELEKVAFVLIKESEPVKEPAEKYVPSGKPRGRPAKPVGEKKAPAPTGRPRGRPARAASASALAREKKMPATKVTKSTSKPARKSAPKSAPEPASESETEVKAESVEPKKRGRPAKVKEDAPTPAVSSAKKRGRPSTGGASSTPAKKTGGPSLAASVKTATPASKKRGRPSSTAAGDAATPASKIATPASKKRGRPSLAAASKASTPASKTATPASKKRGRPSLAAASEAATPATKKRGRPSMASVATPSTAATPASKKRGRPSLAASSNKKLKV